MMIYRWRQEYREGKFVEEPLRKISMTKDTSSVTQNDDKINGSMMRLSVLRNN
jgi:transposase